MANVKAIGDKIGTFVKMDNSKACGIDKSIRIRVLHNVNKPLTTHVKVKMKTGVEECFKVKYERPPLFCFFCGKVGHGTKDCDDDGDNEEQEIKFGGWLKASSWKVGNVGVDSNDSLKARSCAKALFITKPKEKRSEMEHVGVEDMVARMMRLELKEGGKEAKKQGGESDHPLERDDSHNMDQLNQERQANQVEEDHSSVCEQLLQGDTTTKKLVRKWKRVGIKSGDKKKEGEEIVGIKRKSRGRDGSEVDLTEIEEMRALKKKWG